MEIFPKKVAIGPILIEGPLSWYNMSHIRLSQDNQKQNLKVKDKKNVKILLCQARGLLKRGICNYVNPALGVAKSLLVRGFVFTDLPVSFA